MITVPGRHGQRPLNAAVLGAAGASLVFWGLKGLHPWLPGVAAIVVGVLLALFGLVAVGWATAFLLGVVFATAGSVLAHLLHLWVAPIAVLFLGFGLFAGMTNHRRLSVVLPPLFAGFFAAWGAAISWASNLRGARLVKLLDVDWGLGVAGVLAFALLALSFERERRQKLRLAARRQRMDDEKLKAELAGRQAKYQRAIDQAKS
ncbi:MAG: hypothetical protein ABR567_09990 [Myxococcales bacterium]